jgi:hypothetical protein
MLWNKVFLLTLVLPLFITETISDLMLALKIFVLLSIISFVWNHVGNTPLAILLIIGLSWFILFDYWAFFGGVYVLYMLLMFGISGVLVDFFFVSQMGGSEPKPVDSAIDLAIRQQQLQRARQMHAARHPRRVMR